MNTSDSATALSRRSFIKLSAAAGAALFADASGLPAQAASAALPSPRRREPGEKLNMAFIGSGGRGGANLSAFYELGENIVALCDIDGNRLAGAAKRVRPKFPKVRTYSDYRVLLEKEAANLDAVVVSTPDHTHAPAAFAAMRLGLNVYVEKPLVRTIWECRRFAEIAHENGVITQMGNNGNGTDGQRRNIEILRSGILGEISEIHVSTDRPIWRQGLNRPQTEDPVPPSISWALFLGTAPYRPYKKDVYHAFNWRGWFDFGTGALGDIGCHSMSFFFRGLDLRETLSVETIKNTPKFSETYPKATTVKIVAASAKQKKPVTIYWYDGNTEPEDAILPEKLTKHFRSRKAGVFILGSEGIFANSSISLNADEKFTPISKHPVVAALPQSLPRVRGHHWEFAEAIRGGGRPLSDYDHSVPLTELVLLGSISQRVAGELRWDSSAGRFTNSDEANALLKPTIRPGWKI